jgi:segregation and condensation protein B
MNDIPTSAGSAFWAARGVRIEPEPVDEDLEHEGGAEDGAEGGEGFEPGPEPVPGPVSAADGAVAAEPGIGLSDSAPAAIPATAPVPAQASAPDAEPVHALDPEPEAAAAQDTPPDVADIPEVATPTDQIAAADATPEADLVPEPDAVPAAEPAPFIPTQASFDEVEPQLGEPVDGLVALNETLIDAARTKAELAAKAAEPVWQLTDDGLAALPDLRTCLEAILLVVDEPVTEVVLAQIVERPTEQVTAALRALSAEYTSQGRGFDLREVGVGDGSLVTQTGWRFYTRAECAPVVERFIRDGQQSRLTQAALETLAVVAYRQPVSRSKVSAIRGVNCDGVMRTLLARGLVEECGTEYETGALLYRTTGYFLERMGLKGLEELPDLAPLLPSAAEMEDEV